MGNLMSAIIGRKPPDKSNFRTKVSLLSLIMLDGAVTTVSVSPVPTPTECNASSNPLRQSSAILTECGLLPTVVCSD